MKALHISTDKFANIHYRKAGSGPAVVLLHGFPENGTLWDDVVPALASSFTVIIPDIPGSGESLPDNNEASIETLAESIEVILNHEKIDEVVVAGHSMGGYISLAFADIHRARLKGLSLVHSTATADNEEKKETRRKSIDLIRKGGKEAFVKGMIPNLFSAHFKETHPEIIQRQIERGMKLPDESMISFYKAMINRPERTQILSRADFPVQWIIGKEDSVVPLDSALQQCKLATISFVSLYNNCGHMSMLEEPEKLANDLKEFVVFCYNR